MTVVPAREQVGERVAQVWRDGWTDPLVRNAAALWVNTAVTSVLGMAYWVVAARLYSADEVGRDAALVTVIMTLASVAQLNMAVALPRLLPAAHAPARLVAGSYAVSIVFGLLVGAGFLLLGPEASSSLDFVEGGVAAGVVAAIVVWGVFSIQDGALTGARRAVWVPIENAGFGVLKLVALVVCAWSGAGHGVLWSWLLGAALMVAPVNALLFGRVLPSLVPPDGAAAAELAGTALRRFVVVDWIASMLRLAQVTVLPLLVLERLGSDANAWFFAAYSVGSAADAVGMHMATSLNVEAARDPAASAALAQRAARRLAYVIVPVAVALALGAPLVMSIYGAGYASEAAGTLRLFAIATIPYAALSLYGGFERIHGRMGRFALVQGIAAVLVVGLAALLARPGLGIAGAGWAWLIGHAVAATAVVPAIVRHLRGTQ